MLATAHMRTCLLCPRTGRGVVSHKASPFLVAANSSVAVAVTVAPVFVLGTGIPMACKVSVMLTLKHNRAGDA